MNKKVSSLGLSTDTKLQYNGPNMCRKEMHNK